MFKHVYRFLLLGVLCLASLTGADAQQIIRGTITHGISLPVPHSMIAIENVADSSLIQTLLPDTNGKYSVTLSSPVNIRMRVSAEGFVSQQRIVEPGSAKEQVMNFVLVPGSTELGAVTVSGTKPLFERKVDRTIFNVSASLASAGGTAIDAIRKAPGVLLGSQENSISLVGKSTVQVLINDRLLQLSGEDLIAYLRAIPSDNIDRIEVITTPPAQYAAEGSTGLINIVLKKNKKDGLNGELRAGYEQSGYATGLGGGNLNYKKGRMNVFASMNYSNGSKNIIERVNTELPNQQLQLSDPYRRRIRNLHYTAGLDYELNKKSTLSVQLTGTDFKRKDIDIASLYQYDKPLLTLGGLVETHGLSQRNSHNNILTANYSYNMDTAGKKLTLNAAKLWFDGSRDRDYETRYYGSGLVQIGPIVLNQNLGTQEIRITTAQADLELPYKWASLSAGGRLSFTTNDSRNNFLFYENDAFKLDSNISNSFDYEEQVQALYLSASKSAGKFEMRAGLRGEWTKTRGYSARLAQTNTNSYFNLFPTAYVQYKRNDNHVFNMNYSRRINRPSYRALDPYRSYSTPFSFVEGNPFIKPAVADNIEAGYTYKGKYSATAFYQFEPNTFSQVFEVDSSAGITSARFQNYGNSLYYGVNLNGSFQPLKPWELQIQTGGNVQEITTFLFQGQSNKPVGVFYINAQNTVSLNKSKTLVAQANIFYITSYLNDLLLIYPQCNLDAGLRAFFLEKNLVVSLSANDILRTLRVKGENQLTGQTLDSYFDERNVRVMLNYKFGNAKARRERSTGVEEERRRM